MGCQVNHSHDEPQRLHIGCGACIERVKLDQDIAAVSAGEMPNRPPTDNTQIEALMRAHLDHASATSRLLSADGPIRDAIKMARAAVVMWWMDWTDDPMEGPGSDPEGCMRAAVRSWLRANRTTARVKP